MISIVKVSQLDVVGIVGMATHARLVHETATKMKEEGLNITKVADILQLKRIKSKTT